jgi:hypothetical protein
MSPLTDAGRAAMNKALEPFGLELGRPDREYEAEGVARAEQVMSPLTDAGRAAMNKALEPFGLELAPDRKPGDRLVFTTSGSRDGFPIEYWHDRQTCTVVRKLGHADFVDEEAEAMYRVRFEDGVEVDVFGDELTEQGG